MTTFKVTIKIATLVRFFLPTKIANYILQHPLIFKLRADKWKAENPYMHEGYKWSSSDENSFTIGILKEAWGQHWPFIAACRDLDVSYVLLDIFDDNWLDILKSSRCDAFLCRPSVQYKPWKEMYDERLHAFKLIDDRLIFPDCESLWIWESKKRMNYWLKSNDIAHPKTWIFYNINSANQFISKCELPIIFKTDMGSGASGVKIVKERKDLKKLVARCFSIGYSTNRKIYNDKEMGFIILQEYLHNVREWRTARIGDSYFGYEKGSKNGIHSGSKNFIYGRPPNEVLNITKLITDIGDFKSLNVDIFETEDGRFLVNELQAIFGQAGSREICRVDGDSGRMIWNQTKNTWEFEKGEFCQNYMCNLRVKSLIDELNHLKLNKNA